MARLIKALVVLAMGTAAVVVTRGVPVQAQTPPRKAARESASQPADEPAPTLAATPASHVARVPIDWVTIPGGRYWMGSKSGDSDELPLHEVVVGTFQLSRSQVTIAQYRSCVDAGACTAPATSERCNWDVEARGDHPVNCVDWDQAVAFATWAGGRLPTEAEWEYAARSGGKERTYPWGDEGATCSRTVIADGGLGCGRGCTWPGCSKAAGNTVHGVCDMAGNVWEWVEDWYHRSYYGAPSDGSAWDSPSGTLRVYRGGSFGYDARFARAADRRKAVPSRRDILVGFRMARGIPQ